jgi:hypothetical protein
LRFSFGGYPGHLFQARVIGNRNLKKTAPATNESPGRVLNPLLHLSVFLAPWRVVLQKVSRKAAKAKTEGATEDLKLRQAETPDFLGLLRDAGL